MILINPDNAEVVNTAVITLCEALSLPGPVLVEARVNNIVFLDSIGVKDRVNYSE